MVSKKLWSGRFTADTNKIVERFTASVDVDQRLELYDIAGSIAHARMLGNTSVLSDAESESIIAGLNTIREQIESGDFKWEAQLEDVHMNIEARLTNLIGDNGKKLHTARSRNDQVATDMRLYVRDAVDAAIASILNVQQALIGLAEQEAETIMPGFTHMQSAQPVTFGHHLLAWNEMLQRDHARFSDSRMRVNVSPLGSAALAGTSFPIDREMTASELGFDAVCENSLDAISDRDFVIEFCAAASLLMMHLSRMAEEMVLWSSEQFKFVDLGDAFCTGSSIMPQKKNPDVAELIRGKTGRVNGHLHALLMLMKGQPLSYNRDNQEDKQPVFDTADTVVDCLNVLAAMLPGITVNRENMRNAAIRGYATATDLADYLVRKNVPFREAHAIVGQVVRHAIDNGQDLSGIPIDVMQSYCEHIQTDVYDCLTLEGSVSARDHIGGTAPNQVLAAAKRARTRLNS